MNIIVTDFFLNRARKEISKFKKHGRIEQYLDRNQYMYFVRNIVVVAAAAATAAVFLSQKYHSFLFFF